MRKISRIDKKRGNQVFVLNPTKKQAVKNKRGRRELLDTNIWITVRKYN